MKRKRKSAGLEELPPCSHIIPMNKLRSRMSEVIRVLEEDRMNTILVTRKGVPTFVVMQLGTYRDLMNE